MMNLRQSRKPFARRTFFVIVAVVILAVLVQTIPGVRDATHRVASPLFKLGISGGSVWGNITTSFRRKASLSKENDRLVGELKSLQLRTLELPILEEENKRLSELWQRRSFERTLLGRVLSWPNASPYDTLVIDVGDLNGVQSDNVAVVEGVAVGRVAHVFSHTSIVELFSTSGVTETVLLGEDQIPIKAEGRGGGNFIAEVPRDIEVKEGDTVLYPDTKMRVFATVESVQAKAADPFRTIFFRLPVNLFEIDFVEVIIEGARPLSVPEENSSEEEI